MLITFLFLVYQGQCAIDSAYPFPCSDYLCPSYALLDSTCTLPCMIPPCNYDSTDIYSENWFERFQSSNCFSACQKKGCNINRLKGNICEPSCNFTECGYSLGACGYCAPGCTKAMLMNNVCEAQCNNSACMYDNNACGWCAPNCFQSDLISTTCNTACANPQCNYQNSVCDTNFCAKGCSPSMQADEVCQSACNVTSCSFDNWQCTCSIGCTPDMFVNKETCFPECNNENCKFQNGTCGSCASSCYNSMIGNGICDSECNVPNCNYDSGDCGCAPGCGSSYNSAENYWTWDESERGCKLECLVEDCLFNYGICSDYGLIRAAWFQQLIVSDNTHVLDLSKCFGGETCYEELLRNLDEAGVCNKNCDSNDCLGCMGLSKTSSTCSRSYNSICLICSGTNQIYSYCLSSATCPPGYSFVDSLLTPFLCTKICLRDPKKYSELNPFEIYVSLEGNDNNAGTESSPLLTINAALQRCTRKYNKVWIAEGDYMFGVSPIINPIVLDASSPLKTALNLYISQIEIAGHGAQPPKIFLGKDNMKLETQAAKLIISNLIFDGKYVLNQECSEDICTYCPNIDISEGLVIDDRHEVVSDPSIYPQNCNMFATTNFITIISGSELIMTNVTVMNFQQQLNSFISAAGSVSLYNVEFHRIQANNRGSFILMDCKQNCINVNFVFYGGKVEGLNYGYEYSETLIQSGFISTQGINSMYILFVSFTYNMAITGIGETTRNYMINIVNAVGEIAISFCSFKNQFLNGIIKIDSTSLSYTDYTIDLSDYILQYSQTHFSFIFIELHNITSLNCLICFSMGSIQQNIKLDYISFENITANSDGVIKISSTGTVSDTAQNGAWSYVRIQGVPKIGWIQYRNITITNISFKNIHYGGSLLFIVNQPTLMINTISIRNTATFNFEDINTYTILNFANNSQYLSKTLTSSQVLSSFCNYLIYIETIKLVYLSHINLESVSCLGGSSGIQVSDAGYLSMQTITANFSTDSSGIEIFLLTDITEINLSNFNFNTLSQATSAILKVSMAYSLNISDFVGSSLQSYYTSCVYLEKITNLLIKQFSCLNCGTSYGDGGALYIVPNTTNSIINIQEFTCNFCYALVGYGGGINIESYSINLLHTLTMNSIVLDNCKAIDGAGIYITNRVSLMTGLINNIRITNSAGSFGGIFTDVHDSGILYINGFTSENNSGFYSGIKGTYLRSGQKIIMKTAVIKDSKAVSSIFYFTSLMSDNQISLASVSISANKEVNATFLYANTINLDLSDVNIDSGLGIRIEMSKLTGTRLIFNGLDGSAVVSTNSSFKCSSCTFTNIKSGPALYVENQSTFNITDSVFTNIQATKSGMALYINISPGVNIFERCTFTSSTSTSPALIEMQRSYVKLNSCMIKENKSLGVTPGISMINSILFISNSIFYMHSSSMGGFIYASTYSEVNAYNTSFDSGSASLTGGAIYTLMSDFKANLCEFRNNKILSATGSGAAIYGITLSNITLTSCIFTENFAIFSGSSIEYSGSSLIISNSNFHTSSPAGAIISLSGVEVFAFDNSKITGTDSTGILTSMAKEFSAYNSMFHNLKGAIIAISSNETKSKVYKLSNCEFFNNSVVGSGGALSLTECSVSIFGTTFTNNSASSGGAIAYSCPGSFCSFEISNSTFEANKALVEGGAIKWEDRKPSSSNLTYKNNSAPYGGDSASFPALLEFSFRSRHLKSGFIECVPGQPCNQTLKLYIKDSLGNTMTLDNSSVAIISSTDLEHYSVTGQSKETAVNGVFTMQNYIVSGKPLSEVYIAISTSSIDPAKAAEVGDTVNYTNTATVLVKLRNCTVGEQMSQISCIECSAGSYVIDPAASCNNCPTGGNCTGGWKIYPTVGYWKSTKLSEIVYSCPNSAACLGSIDDNDFIGSCADGYVGIQCFGCKTGYSRVGTSRCSKCPDKLLNGFILTVLAIFMVLQGVILVSSTIKSAYSKSSLYSIYIKIFTNYIQLVFLTTQFQLNWPWFVIELFQAQKSVASASDQIFSLDCYLDNPGTTYQQMFFRTLIFMSLLPVIIWLVALIVWFLISAKKKKWGYMRKEYFTTMIVLFFLVYPNIVKIMFSVFSCVYISESGYWMTDNLEIQCWDNDHMHYALSVAIPSIVTWAIGVPTIVLILLHKRRNNFTDDTNRVIFGFLFNGYKRSRYYWEFLIMYRKIIIICISVFMTQVPQSVQGLTLIIVLIISLYLQYELKPYNLHQLNHMEMEAILTATVTIYCGLYYLSDGIGDILSIILFVIIVFGNIYFVVYWLYYMLSAVIDFLSNIFMLFKKLTGKTDPYPEYIHQQQLKRKGVFRDEQEGILNYTLFRKYPSKMRAIFLKGIADSDDIYKKVFYRHAENIKAKDEKKEEGGKECNDSFGEISLPNIEFKLSENEDDEENYTQIKK